MARFNSLSAWLNWQEQCHPRLIDLGLDRVTQVFKRLYPNYVKPLTIIVGGTNGKGSCIAFLEAIYLAQGYHVGSYTSPHLSHYHERIKINGIPVTNDSICDAFARIDTVRHHISLSYFEFSTLAALDIFSRKKVDIQLLEVGLGGRLDAVNIINADLSLISSIGIDHVDWLGSTRDAIAVEKAGIFRPKIVSVIGDQTPPPSLFLTAKEKQTPLLCLHQDFDYQLNLHDWSWKSPVKTYHHLPIPTLKGQHQFNNAASVLMAVTQLQSLAPVEITAIQQGFVQAQLKGRFQWVERDIPLLLDVAHNPDAVNKLAQYLYDQFNDRKIYAIFSIMKDKDIHGILERMKPLIDHWFISPLQTPRVINQTVLQQCFKQKKIHSVSLGFKNFKETLHAAEKKAHHGELILIFGSFLLVSEYLMEYENNAEEIYENS